MYTLSSVKAVPGSHSYTVVHAFLLAILFLERKLLSFIINRGRTTTFYHYFYSGPGEANNA